jgi:hypothetical protein
MWKAGPMILLILSLLNEFANDTAESSLFILVSSEQKRIHTMILALMGLLVWLFGYQFTFIIYDISIAYFLFWMACYRFFYQREDFFAYEKIKNF